jgi:DNA topoisomerase-1
VGEPRRRAAEGPRDGRGLDHPCQWRRGPHVGADGRPLSGALAVESEFDEQPAAVEDAAVVGLRYVSAGEPGIERRPRRGAFEYRAPSGAVVKDELTLGRIRSLAIPPAWTDVWICPDPNGHLQATGRDAKGRKQYRYHPKFRERREAGKFDRIIEFGERLPKIRRRVTRDLSARGMPRDKVLAAMVRLLELTHLRVGNDEYAKLNKSFGLSTLRDRHAQIRGETVRFKFRGKGGRVHEVGVTDRHLASIVRRCQALPGQHLFQYVDDAGETHEIGSEAVNDYIRRAAGDDSFSAKDFRTWAATVFAFRALQAAEPAAKPSVAKRQILSAVEEAAEQLGNTPTIARKSYVHPVVLETYLNDGGLPAVQAVRRRRLPPAAPPSPAEEQAVLALLRAKAEDARASKAAKRGRRYAKAAAGATLAAAATEIAGAARTGD